MKLKNLLVISLFSLFVAGCSFASAQTFGFASLGGGLFCNYEQLVYAGGGLWGGVDNLSACGASVNSTIAGFSATVANDGEAAHGAGVVYGDSIFAAYEGDPEAQWTVFTKLKCNPYNPKTGRFKGASGWIGVAAFSGFEAGTNIGFLSCKIPGREGVAPTMGPAIHADSIRAKK